MFFIPPKKKKDEFEYEYLYIEDIPMIAERKQPPEEEKDSVIVIDLWNGEEEKL